MSDKIESEKKNITIFGEETEFDGTLEFKDRLVITGKFVGNISAPTGDLEIAKSSNCEIENLEVNSIVISGNVKGNIFASERVEICSGSRVDSNITTARIRIANNVDYSGEITMLDKQPDVDLFSVSSSEFKQAMFLHTDVVK